jgi:nicotinamide mononucleotide transporter
MEVITDFFLEPYRHAGFLNIGLEFIAALFGVISVFFAKRESIWVYPTGIISTGLYVYLLAQWNLYGDLIINVYYTLMSIYGWYMWARIIDDEQNHIPITRSGRMDKIKTFGIFAFTSAFVIAVYRHYEVMPRLGWTDSIQHVFKQLSSGSLEEFRLATPYLDTFTTGVFFAAMWLMANKKLENWTFWIIGNIVSIPLYFVKGYGFTGIQYSIFLVLAVQGYSAWKKKIEEKDI